MPTYQSKGRYRSSTGILDKNKLILALREGPHKSRLSPGSYYWTFTWYDVATHSYFKTHVDTEMDNFSAWEGLCYAEDPYGVFEGLAEAKQRKGKVYDMPVISADGLPERWYAMSQEKSHEVILEDIEQITRPNQFKSLFE